MFVAFFAAVSPGSVWVMGAGERRITKYTINFISNVYLQGEWQRGRERINWNFLFITGSRQRETQIWIKKKRHGFVNRHSPKEEEVTYILWKKSFVYVDRKEFL